MDTTNLVKPISTYFSFRQGAMLSFFTSIWPFWNEQRHELLYIVFAKWIFQLIVSPIWLTYCQYGPLEWLWRSLSYLKKQPFVLTSKTNQ
jgi:uncharacterized membrane protein YeiB